MFDIRCWNACTFIYYFVDPYSSFTWFGCRVATSLGRRWGAQCLWPRVLHLQDCSQVEWFFPEWDPGQNPSQALVSRRSARPDFSWGWSSPPRIVFTHCTWRGAAVACVGRWGSRCLSHPFSQHSWLRSTSPTTTFDLWYIQVRKRRLWEAGAGLMGGIKASWRWVRLLGDGPDFWRFWDWLRARQTVTSLPTFIARDGRWWH